MTEAEREELLIEMQSLHASRREAIRRRLGEFRDVDPSEYFYELVYCLLTPQTSAENAGRAVDKLRELPFGAWKQGSYGSDGTESLPRPTHVRLGAFRRSSLLLSTHGVSKWYSDSLYSGD